MNVFKASGFDHDADAPGHFLRETEEGVAIDLNT